MFVKMLTGAVALMAASAVVVSAAPKDEVIAAAKKLEDTKNYSWRVMTESASGAAGGFGGGTVEGKTQEDGLTMTMTTFGNTDRVTYSKGDKFVMQGQNGAWQSLADMQQQFGQGRQGGAPGGPGGAQGGQGGPGGAQGGPGGFGGQGGRGGRGGIGGLGTTPAAAAVELFAKLPDDLKKTGDTYVAVVTGDGINDFMGRGGRGGRGGQAGPGGTGAGPGAAAGAAGAPGGPAAGAGAPGTPGGGPAGQNGPGGRGGFGGQALKNGKATIKIWVRDGLLTKYETTIEGTQTGRNGDETDAGRVITNEFAAIGTTKVTIPDEAKAKLEQP